MRLLIIVLGILLFSCSGKRKSNVGNDMVIPIEFNKVILQDGFWKKWVETATESTIPASFQKCEETGRIDNFIFAGGLKEGKYVGKYGFNDSDVYKIIEGASFSLSLNHDAEMEAYLDTLISYIAAAQEDNGYIYTPWSLKANEYNEFYCCTYSDDGKWLATSGASHEFYNVGHMYEAAVAHFRATGKRSFLDIALKSADLVYDVCIEQGNNYVPGHQEIEIGLIKLYRVTGDERYLDLTKHLLDIRAEHSSGEYSQAHLPVTAQKEAVGHAVRANYMYTAMTDIAALTNDTAYVRAVEKLWQNVVQKKLSITGGVGASHEGEAYGDNFELPNQPYNETCAAIANVYWNYRMFLLNGDSKYFDVLERTLYNGLISGLSLDGKTFFYPNTLNHDGHHLFNRGVNGRSPWFDCSCCPSNLSRFVPSVAGYAYARQHNDVFVNLFMNSKVSFDLPRGELSLQQETQYPWKGEINLRILNEAPVDASLKIRIPGWAHGEAVPSGLFEFEGSGAMANTIQVNGEDYPMKLENGYAVIERNWKQGDKVSLNLHMQVQVVRASEKVAAKQGLAAIQYGPLVYCAEAADNTDVNKISLAADRDFTVAYQPELLGGVNMLTSGNAYFIPYYSWANREMGPMKVWMPFEE